MELTLLSRVAYREKEVTAPRMRGLLALLAGELRTGCSSERLVDGLWRDQPPEHPAKALQVLVSRTRAQLGADMVASTPSGYRLALTEEQVDTAALRADASVSARHARRGDHADALAVAEAGLALWDGKVEGELDDPLGALRAESAATRQSLVRVRALALSRLGQRSEAVEALAALHDERPRDEEILLELLRCEAATAGPAAALIRYDAYRRALRDELGADPGPVVQALHRELLQGTAPPIRHGVLHEPNPLLGRDDDVAALASLLQTSRVTSIVGAGGLGKTRLAHVVSQRAAQRAVHFVELAGVTTDDDVVDEVASVLGVGGPRRTGVGRLGLPTDVLAGIVGALGTGSTLLVLDNCEHVIDGAAELVQALVSMTRDLRVLTTSRTPLGLSSESVYLLPGLALKTTVELFTSRARAARQGVELPGEVVEELCRHLDGLPLAAELAAARVRVMSVGEIAARLEDRFSLLRGGPRDAPERHKTLQAVVDWSWNLLAPTAQAALRALSIFPGGFTADAARQVLDDADALQTLEDLVDQSLLEVVDAASGSRFRMLETVREFGSRHREAAGESGHVLEGFLTWARAFGIEHHAAPFGADPFGSCDLIRAEQDNVMLALREGLARRDGATVAATSAVLGGLWMIESEFARLSTLEESAEVLSHYRPDPEHVDVVRMVLTLILLSTYMLRGLGAVRSLATLRRLPVAPPDTVIRAAASVLRAASDRARSDLAALRDLGDSDQPLVAGVANVFASYRWERESDLDAALLAARRMLDSFDSHDHPWMRMVAHARIGELCLQVEDGEGAVRHLGAAYRMQEALGARSDLASLRWALVLANLQLGATDEAERWAELAIVSDPDDVGTATFDLGMRGEIALARGDIDEGLRLWRLAIEGLRDADVPIPDMDPGLDPWVLEVKSVAVTAHARHGRTDRVEEIVADLPRRLTTMLADPMVNPPTYLMDRAVSGVVLLALGVVDLELGARTGDERANASGARLVALAERFHFLRTFHPTMSSALAREAAVRAGKSAYDDTVSSSADLDPAELRSAALAALKLREQVVRGVSGQPGRG